MRNFRPLLSRLTGRFRPAKPLCVDFYAATWIDEIWVRSSVLAAKRAGITVRMVISGDRAAWPGELPPRFADAGVPLEWAPTVDALHELGMKVVVTASSGIPRSYFGETLSRLIHMPHSLASLHVIYPPDAFDGCDTLFAAGPHHAREFQALGLANGLGERETHAVGYGKFDVMRAEATTPGPGGRHVLVAPSWGDNNLISLHGLRLTEALVEDNWRVTLRPHPSFFVYPDDQLDAILARFAEHPMVAVERSTGGSRALWEADAMISDYSGMALEFAALRRRPVVFVDGPRKMLNPGWEALGLPAAEIDLRGKVGMIAGDGVAGTIATLATVADAMAPDASALAMFLHNEPDVGARVAALLSTSIAEVA